MIFNKKSFKMTAILRHSSSARLFYLIIYLFYIHKIKYKITKVEQLCFHFQCLT